MDIKIQVLSIAQEAKQSAKGSTYQQLEIAYKDLTNAGKVASKKIMDFSSKDVFQVLAHSKPVEVFDISMEKKGDYWNWVKATKSDGIGNVQNQNTSSPKSGVSAGAGTTAKGGWETPEERAKKQIYIVRQSSISAAVNALSVGVKSPPKAVEVIEYARELEQYVFECSQAQAVANKDVGGIEGLEEDPIPF